MVPNSSHSRSLDSVAAAAATDWLALLWRRKLIVVAVTALVLVMGFLYYQRAIPIYQSTAQVLLIKNETELPITGAVGQFSYEDALSTHLILIRSPLIVSRAISKHRLGALSSLKSVRDPEATIIDSLEAVRGGTRDAPDPNVIILSYRGIDRKDCAVVLDAVVQSYQEYLGETYQDFSDQTVKLITRAKDELDRQLREKEASYREFRASTPHLLTNPNGDKSNIHELRIAEIEEARAEQLLKNSQIKARMESIEETSRRGGNREALTLLAKQSSASTGGRTPFDAIDRQLIDSLLEEQLLLDDFGGEHPDVVSVRRRIAMLRQHSGGMSTEEGGKPLDFLSVYLESLHQELAVGVEQLSELDDLFAREQESARALATYQLADQNFRSEIGRLQTLFDGVIKRLEEINLVPEHGGVKTQVISPPALGEQVEPNRLVVGLLSFALGLVLGAGVAFVAEKTDQRFRSPEDLRHQLGLPIVGHIPVITSTETKGNEDTNHRTLDPSLCTFHTPDDAASEAYRSVRTSLYFSSRGAGHRVVQVTSPIPGDGKTTLCANLAVSAADSGKNVLLIEADFRRPRLANIFSLNEDNGVSAVIGLDTDLDEAIQQTEVANLSVMPCGPRPNNPSELLTSPRFQQLLDTVREQFDLILVDTPPLLAVTDPAVVAPRVDTVLLVVSLGRNVRYVANRAAEILEGIGANVLGVVVNRLDRSSGYGGDGYGSRYGYRYQDGYRYGYGAAYSSHNGNGTKSGKGLAEERKTTTPPRDAASRFSGSSQE